MNLEVILVDNIRDFTIQTSRWNTAFGKYLPPFLTNPKSFMPSETQVANILPKAEFSQFKNLAARFNMYDSRFQPHD